MSRNCQPFFTDLNSGVSLSCEMLKEQHEVAVLATPRSSVSLRTTVVNIQSETAVPDHIVCSLFNTLFFHPGCLGFVVFTYSMKPRDQKMVGDLIGVQNYASTAKCLNIWALVLGLIILGVITAAIVNTAASMGYL